jgi:predicted DNA-binding transcriptional regulator AlpA
MSLLQAKDVAAILNCSESHVYQLDRRGLLPCSVVWPCEQKDKNKKAKVLRRWTEEDVETFIERHKTGRNNESI